MATRSSASVSREAKEAWAFDDGMVVLAGNSGKLALSRDNGQSFETKNLPGRGYASVLKRSDGELLVVGDRGITPVPAALLAK